MNFFISLKPSGLDGIQYIGIKRELPARNAEVLANIPETDGIFLLIYKLELVKLRLN